MKHCLRHIICLTAILTVAVMHSCTEVELCENGYHPHHAKLAFKFNWENATPDGHCPDHVEGMMIFANRVIDTWRAGFIVSLPEDERESISQGQTFFGNLSHNSEEVSGDQTTDGTSADDSATGVTEGSASVVDFPTANEEERLKNLPINNLEVKEGEYQFIAINYKHNECVIERDSDFQNNLLVASAEIFIKFKTYDKKDRLFKALGHTWQDHNEYGNGEEGISGRYVDSEILPTYVGIEGIHSAKSGSSSLVEIKPECITQCYNLHLSIEKEKGVRIEEVVGIMAGIPARIGFTTKYVDPTYTSKMAFRIPVDSTLIADYDSSRPEALDDSTSLPFKTTFNSIGLVRSSEESRIKGPGILQLCVYTSTPRENGTGRRITKTIYAVINLYNTIGEAKPMVMTEDGNYLIQNGDSVTLRIPNALRIEKGEILEAADEDNSLDRWTPARGFEIDV